MAASLVELESETRQTGRNSESVDFFSSWKAAWSENRARSVAESKTCRVKNEFGGLFRIQSTTDKEQSK